MEVICYHADVCKHLEKEVCSMSKPHEYPGATWQQKFKGIPFYYGYCPHKIRSASGITADRRQYVRMFEPFYIHIVREFLRRKKHEDMEM
jgi:hypothetical protein